MSQWVPPSWQHIYVSTYCQHAAHLDCPRECKLCGDPCHCDCHLPGEE